MISEEQLKAAAQEAGEALLDSLPQRDQCVRRFSPRFERRMEGLLQKHRRPAALGRVAGFLLALLLGGTIWLSVDAEAQGVAAGWFRQTVESAFVYRFAGSAEDVDRNVEYTLTWLPEGTVEIDAWQDDTSGTIVYQDIDGQYFSFSYYMDSGSAPTIITNADVTTITTEKLTGDFYDAEGLEESNGLVWEDPKNGAIFVLSAYFGLDDLMQIAENVVAE